VQGDVTREAIEEVLKEFRGVRGESPVTDEELTDKKNNLTKGCPQDFQSIAGVAGQLQTIIAYGLSLDEWETYVDRVNQVDVTKALAAARDLIDPDALLIVVVGDQAQIEPRIREMNLGEVYIASTP
jgi:zinc protease